MMSYPSSIGYGSSALEDDFAQGYRDGRDIDCPEPSGNRSPAYKHSFEVGRAEILNKPIPAHISRAKAAKIRDDERYPYAHDIAAVLAGKA